MILYLLPLLTLLLPTNFVSSESMTTSLGFKSLSAAPAPSAVSQGCDLVCSDPLTLAPVGSPCMCVFPMRVTLLLGISLYDIFPEVEELTIEFAAGTYLEPSQVQIFAGGVYAQNPEKTVVDINLVPRGEKFDNTTVILTYQRILHKKVPINMTIFGDYDVKYIAYQGIPFPPFGSSFVEGPTRSIGHPTADDFVGKHRKMTPQIVIFISLSAFVLLLVSYVVVQMKKRSAQTRAAVQLELENFNTAPTLLPF